MFEKTKTFGELRNFVSDLPVIDCHEHGKGPLSATEYKEPIASLICGYVRSDLLSAGISQESLDFLNNHDIPTEKKWRTFEKFWRKTEHTAYARVTKIIMEKFYGEKEMGLASLKRIAGKLLNLKEEKTYYGILKKAGIKCRLVNIFDSTAESGELKRFLEGKYNLPESDRLLIPLILFHWYIRSRVDVEGIGKLVNRDIRSLDQYLDACKEVFTGMKKRGAVGFKDQSAYGRPINFENTPRDEAEKLFNYIMSNPNNFLVWPYSKPLGDYLFYRFMEMAEELGLPVQIHTGHMAGIENEISKTNAVHLTPLLEHFKKIKFDLFHGNWPYMGELLFLGKNYPNVSLDLCWLHIIDPYYAREFLCHILTAVPHSKIHGFGGDYRDFPEYSAAHLEIAKDVIASSLSRMVDGGWLSVAEAKKIAVDWVFNNPNEFFKLGFKPIEIDG